MVVVGHSKRGSMSTAALLVCSVVILATCSVVPSAHAYTYHIPDLQEPAGDGSTVREKERLALPNARP